jgi:hypothetical protein
VSFGLAGRPLPIGELAQDQTSIPVAVTLETDAPVDDIKVDLRGGGRVFLQVKSSVAVSKRDQQFVAALAQVSASVSLVSQTRNQTRRKCRRRILVTRVAT